MVTFTWLLPKAFSSKTQGCSPLLFSTAVYAEQTRNSGAWVATLPIGKRDRMQPHQTYSRRRQEHDHCRFRSCSATASSAELPYAEHSNDLDVLRAFCPQPETQIELRLRDCAGGWLRLWQRRGRH